jgi:crossover junction endodeoxyribonuclease RuvC
MKILGVDPALQITGYGVIDDAGSRFTHIASGIIKTRACQPLQERLNAIYSGISGVIQQHRPEVLVLEKVFVHQAHTTTAFLLGQARGTIVLAAAHRPIPVIEYASTQVKKSVVGRGHANKEQVQRMVMSLIKMPAQPAYFDVTDALALALAYSYFNRNSDLAGILAAHRQ